MNYVQSIEKYKHILITGGTGLLGKRVWQLLVEKGCEITLLVRPGNQSITPHKNITIIEADLSEKFVLTKSSLGSVDAIIHLAQSEGHDNLLKSASNIISVTINALFQLVEIACSLGVKKLVFASSGGVYGGGNAPMSENENIKTSDSLSFYLASKAAAENLLKHFEKYLNFTILRYFFIYGPGQKSEMLIPRMIDSILNQREIVLTSEEGPILNPIFVEDAAKATVASLLTNSNIINIAGDEQVSLKYICEVIGSLCSLPPKFVIKNEHRLNFIGDNRLMHKELHVPEVRLKEGLRAFF